MKGMINTEVFDAIRAAGARAMSLEIGHATRPDWTVRGPSNRATAAIFGRSLQATELWQLATPMSRNAAPELLDDCQGHRQVSAHCELEGPCVESEQSRGAR